MRSRANYNGHPIHPAIIPFPFAFIVGAFGFDVAGWLFSLPTWWTTGGLLAVAGVLTALIAAVPGFVDYRYSIPPKSSGKKRATRHMVTNLSAVTAIALACVVRRMNDSELTVLALEAVGASLLLYGSSMSTLR